MAQKSESPLPSDEKRMQEETVRLLKEKQREAAVQDATDTEILGMTTPEAARERLAQLQTAGTTPTLAEQLAAVKKKIDALVQATGGHIPEEKRVEYINLLQESAELRAALTATQATAPSAPVQVETDPTKVRPPEPEPPKPLGRSRSEPPPPASAEPAVQIETKTPASEDVMDTDTTAVVSALKKLYSERVALDQENVERKVLDTISNPETRERVRAKGLTISHRASTGKVAARGGGELWFIQEAGSKGEGWVIPTQSQVKAASQLDWFGGLGTHIAQPARVKLVGDTIELVEKGRLSEMPEEPPLSPSPQSASEATPPIQETVTKTTEESIAQKRARLADLEYKEVNKGKSSMSLDELIEGQNLRDDLKHLERQKISVSEATAPAARSKDFLSQEEVDALLFGFTGTEASGPSLAPAKAEVPLATPRAAKASPTTPESVSAPTKENPWDFWGFENKRSALYGELDSLHPNPNPTSEPTFESFIPEDVRQRFDELAEKQKENLDRGDMAAQEETQREIDAFMAEERMKKWPGGVRPSGPTRVMPMTGGRIEPTPGEPSEPQFTPMQMSTINWLKTRVSKLNNLEDTRELTTDESAERANLELQLEAYKAKGIAGGGGERQEPPMGEKVDMDAPPEQGLGSPRADRSKLRTVVSELLKRTHEHMTQGSERFIANRKYLDELDERAKQLDARAGASGGERIIRKMGEAYNKLNWREKLGIGTVLFGSALVTGGASIYLPYMFAGLLGAQRAFGAASLYISQEKALLDAKVAESRQLISVKERASISAALSGILFGAAIGKSIQWANDSGAVERTREWLGSMLDHLLPGIPHSLEPEATGAAVSSPGTQPSGAAVAPAPASVDTPTPAPATEAPVPPPAPAADTVPPASAGGSAARVEATTPPPAAAAPDISRIEVQAAPGRGYEDMAYRLWDELQGKNIDASKVPADSDLATLLAADKDSLKRVLHDLAIKHEIFKPNGTSVLINLNDKLSFGPDGNLKISNGLTFENAPAGAPLTPPYSPEPVPIRESTQELRDYFDKRFAGEAVPEAVPLPTAEYDPNPAMREPPPEFRAMFTGTTLPAESDLAQSESAPLESATISEQADVVPASDSPLPTEGSEGVETQAQPEAPAPAAETPAPAERANEFINKQNVPVDPTRGQVFQDTNGATIAYGNDWGERLKAAQEYATKIKDPNMSVWVQSAEPYVGPDGVARPYVVEVKYVKGLFFGGGPQVLIPNGPPELSQIGGVNPDTFTKRLDQ